MRYSHIIVGLSMCIALLSGCSSKKDEQIVPDKPAAELYQEAQKNLMLNDYRGAESTLEALDNRYPFGPYADQTQLKLIYVYYKRSETEKALANIDRFIRNNPTSPALAYVYYMRGLTNEAADYNFSQSLLGIDRATRDPSFITSAFKDFKVVLQHYPNSDYAADARRRMLDLQEKLARHDLAIAEYYLKREAYIAAVNRAKQIIENYPNSAEKNNALRVMIRGYRSLGLHDLEQQAQQVLQAQRG
ncbi:outer membrane protein assembly factor BamD [Celerinatantimonas sp. YJH-8]|uniref:outer membrane protein assembly factor BamD n=1 Tax=Celerinatantimonas sp. YJH-8 TaxID=3228714 RepID=UPI0038BE6E9F